MRMFTSCIRRGYIHVVDMGNCVRWPLHGGRLLMNFSNHVLWYANNIDLLSGRPLLIKDLDQYTEFYWARIFFSWC